MNSALKVGEWNVMHHTLVGGASGSIIQRTFLAPDGTQWAVTKARSTAKHSNGVEYLIHRNGEIVDYSRKLHYAMQKVEAFAAGTEQPEGY